MCGVRNDMHLYILTFEQLKPLRSVKLKEIPFPVPDDCNFTGVKTRLVVHKPPAKHTRVILAENFTTWENCIKSGECEAFFSGSSVRLNMCVSCYMPGSFLSPLWPAQIFIQVQHPETPI